MDACESWAGLCLTALLWPKSFGTEDLGRPPSRKKLRYVLGALTLRQQDQGTLRLGAVDVVDARGGDVIYDLGTLVVCVDVHVLGVADRISPDGCLVSRS